ncbi:MAG: hypothetical protein ACJ75J_16400 [Cytophagaceae bacterium]|jgi:PRTRC genetic system protein B
MDLNWISKSFEPSKVIVAYKNNHDYYLEVHSITDKGLSPGVPLTKKALNKIIKTIKGSEVKSKPLKFGGPIPENLIYYNCDPKSPYLVWFMPAGKKNLYWTPAMNIPDGSAHVPPMVFVADKEMLKVYALADNKKPSLNTPLFIAPFCNITNGIVCIGNTSRAAVETIEGLMERSERIFWDTRFSGHAMDNDASIIRGFNFYHFWKERIAKPDESFPVDVLVPTKETMEDLI